MSPHLFFFFFFISNIYSKIQLWWGDRFNLGIILIFLYRSICCDPSLEASQCMFPWGIRKIVKKFSSKTHITVIILNIGTDRSEQTVQTQIRLLLMEQSDQGLLCLLLCLHLLNTILHCKIHLFQLWDNYGNYFRCPNF